MATYIAFLRYTQKAREAIKESPARREAARKLFASAGANLKHVYITMGRYDAVVIAEAPDDATMARMALTGASQGFIQTETMRAFTEEEADKIIASLP
ncbi:MAG TPA: GYD domain-containing protein [Terriglobia bacterium]|nr:GYD domain-containing protein [Terriglobia bacterium]